MLRPDFIDGPRGHLFTVLHAPDQPAGNGPGVLYLPPFGEEMNRTRRMPTLLGQRLAERGAALLVLDPFGTGDSAGELEDATWDGWRDDATAGAAHLQRLGYRPAAAVGLRTGAHLALTSGLPRALLWQPVPKGATFLTQLLRVRTAAALDGGETTKSLRQRLRDGETLEIGGYPLTPAMADALEALSLAEAAAEHDGAIDWLTVSPDGSPPPAAQGLLPGVTPRAVAGSAFWAIEETTLVPALVEATVDRLLMAAKEARAA